MTQTTALYIDVPCPFSANRGALSFIHSNLHEAMASRKLAGYSMSSTGNITIYLNGEATKDLLEDVTGMSLEDMKEKGITVNN